MPQRWCLSGQWPVNRGRVAVDSGWMADRRCSGRGPRVWILFFFTLVVLLIVPSRDETGQKLKRPRNGAGERCAGRVVFEAGRLTRSRARIGPARRFERPKGVGFAGGGEDAKSKRGKRREEKEKDPKIESKRCHETKVGQSNNGQNKAPSGVYPGGPSPKVRAIARQAGRWIGWSGAD